MRLRITPIVAKGIDQTSAILIVALDDCIAQHNEHPKGFTGNGKANLVRQPFAVGV